LAIIELWAETSLDPRPDTMEPLLDDDVLMSGISDRLAGSPRPPWMGEIKEKWIVNMVL